MSLNNALLEMLDLANSQLKAELDEDIEEFSIEIKCQVRNGHISIQYMISLKWGDIVFGETMEETLDELIRRTIYQRGRDQEVLEFKTDYIDDIKVGGTDAD
jgi:hypothetical protein